MIFNQPILRLIIKSLICFGLILSGTYAASSQTDNPRLPLHIDILHIPSLANAGGQKFIVYELHLTNFYQAPLTLQKVEVMSGGKTVKPLAEFTDEKLLATLNT
jgi:hypothetical protein